ncbi:DUF924 domain-containing protein [Marinomonas sp. C2222]|uniref:DUF924 domain-containing protein n=1 Tax=Marinomonas sargassi TaxID=2984494 RepID=A0ABT2YUT7_9GAMM|nr:DUF924 family protein [Marinomonas sargassi]MCV2403364.1 DUF924 domain-containing protein [Marinomonas sargassi]
MQPNDVLSFWFEEVEESKWWVKDTEFDGLIIKRFSKIHNQAIQGELYEWRSTPAGRLAEVIVLDQFSRNMYRGDAKSFAYDSLSLILSQEAIRVGADMAVPMRQRGFFYLPFMHSESKTIHEQAVFLYDKLGNSNNLEFERKHKAIIDRFGRYPHRNKILARVSTQEEIDFLSGPNSSF